MSRRGSREEVEMRKPTLQVAFAKSEETQERNEITRQQKAF
jgi:hypothetical protein